MKKLPFFFTSPHRALLGAFAMFVISTYFGTMFAFRKRQKAAPARGRSVQEAAELLASRMEQVKKEKRDEAFDDQVEEGRGINVKPLDVDLVDADSGLEIPEDLPDLEPTPAQEDQAEDREVDVDRIPEPLPQDDEAESDDVEHVEVEIDIEEEDLKEAESLAEMIPSPEQAPEPLPEKDDKGESDVLEEKDDDPEETGN